MSDERAPEAELDAALEQLIADHRPRRVVVVSGAGISAASGIPTFRGPEGYWTVGAREYRPQELATRAAFEQMPREVWRWYLYRRGVCRAAEPNAAHHALAELEAALGDDFALISQNVDGLHLRAGNSLARTMQVHGNTDYMRPVDGGSPLPIPEQVPALACDEVPDDAVWALLVDDQGQPTRPHVLWFDECYDEALYRSDSAVQAAARCDLMVTIGSSGAASLPWHAVAVAEQRGAALIDINPALNPFAERAQLRHREGRGLWLAGPSTTWMPRLTALVAGLRESSPSEP